MSQETKYSAYSLIAKKRDGEVLSPDEIKWFINGLSTGAVEDAQMSAMLMAIYLQGFDKKETAALTDAMLYSGDVLDFNDPTVIDKHSTGGVGDKTSFILAPLAAACGVKVPMIAGRGLGHTGGTVDKIEAVDGFNVSLSMDEFKSSVVEHGLVLMGQTGEIAPADKKIYSLRDVTATVESIPLITASIMSKKLAEGASGIVMDIKAGPGAFMKTKAQARKLARSLSDTAVRFDKNMMTIISDMSQPLGNTVGNSLEIIESIEVLRNEGPKDITDISVSLAGGMVHLAGLAKTHAAGIKKVRAVLKSGEGLKKFRELIERQGGDPTIVDDPYKLPLAKERTEVPSLKSGYVTGISCLETGLNCVRLGGGREKSSDQIDFGVGFDFHKKVGSKVKEGESLLTIYHHANQSEIVKELVQEFQTKNISIKGKKPANIPPLIIEVDTRWS